MEFVDRPLNCIDCKTEFVFTAGEQEFYQRKGFRELPKRCKPCREARRNQRDGGRGGGAREMFDATCASCGGSARVPFRPTAGRPVYCQECFASGKGQRSGVGNGA
jgi:CxxC-x17-CxxC domain-containing protein